MKGLKSPSKHSFREVSCWSTRTVKIRKHKSDKFKWAVTCLQVYKLLHTTHTHTQWCVSVCVLWCVCGVVCVWCGLVWCGVCVWCGEVLCGVVCDWCGVVCMWCGVCFVWFGVVWCVCGVVCVWCGVVYVLCGVFGMLWCGVCGMLWCGVYVCVCGVVCCVVCVVWCGVWCVCVMWCVWCGVCV